jgi:elongation factor Ts
MVEISAVLVKELRDKTGAAMMDCKKALVEAAGDQDKACEWLRQKGIATATKKAARAASEGVVVSKISADGKAGILIEINCETDFVARNEEFVRFCNEIADIALSSRSTDVDTLLSQKNGSGTVAEAVKNMVAKTGENMVVRRLAYLTQSGPGFVASYVHALGSKMGALLAMGSSQEASSSELTGIGRDIAMHIVSAKPRFISKAQIPQEVIEDERRIESGKEDLAKKPPEIRDKIIAGRVEKLLAERCLLDQPFIKDPNQTIAQFLKTRASVCGVELAPQAFHLYILGEDADA